MLNVDDVERRDLTEEGVWTSFEGSQLLVTHMSSISFQRAISRAQQPYRKKIEEGKLDPMIMRRLTCAAMSEGLVLDWKDVVNAQKQPVSYDPKRMAAMLMKNAQLREYLSEFSMQLANFYDEELEDLGNDSLSGSSG